MESYIFFIGFRKVNDIGSREVYIRRDSRYIKNVFLMLNLFATV